MYLEPMSRLCMTEATLLASLASRNTASAWPLGRPDLVNKNKFGNALLRNSHLSMLMMTSSGSAASLSQSAISRSVALYGRPLSCTV